MVPTSGELGLLKAQYAGKQCVKEYVSNNEIQQSAKHLTWLCDLAYENDYLKCFKRTSDLFYHCSFCSELVHRGKGQLSLKKKGNQVGTGTFLV